MTADDRFIKECEYPRPGWHPAQGPDHLGCMLPEFHRGRHRNVAGYVWDQDPKLPDVGRLLYGLITDEQWACVSGLDGVFRLPGSDIIVVSPTGLVRLMGQGNGQTRWYGGRMEILMNEQLVTLWPL